MLVTQRMASFSLWQLESEDATVAGDVETPPGDKDRREVAQPTHAIARGRSIIQLFPVVSTETVQPIIAFGSHCPNDRLGAAIRRGDDRRTPTIHSSTPG